MSKKIKRKQMLAWRNFENYSPEYIISLNRHLIKTQKVSDKNIKKLFELHAEKILLYKKAAQFLYEKSFQKKLKKKDRKKMQEFNDTLEKLEFRAQETWGFEKLPEYHIWWLDMPGCECPYYDNIELQGSPFQVITPSCPWHGDSIGKLIEDENNGN